MDPDVTLTNARDAAERLRRHLDTDTPPGEDVDLDDLTLSAAADLLQAFEDLDTWLSHNGFAPKAWNRVLQILVTNTDHSQVGIFLAGNDADVMLRPSPGGGWGPPLPRADTAHEGTAHVPGTYHIGEW